VTLFIYAMTQKERLDSILRPPKCAIPRIGRERERWGAGGEYHFQEI